jgi:hypothetical protein
MILSQKAKKNNNENKLIINLNNNLEEIILELILLNKIYYINI